MSLSKMVGPIQSNKLSIWLGILRHLKFTRCIYPAERGRANSMKGLDYPISIYEAQTEPWCVDR